MFFRALRHSSAMLEGEKKRNLTKKILKFSIGSLATAAKIKVQKKHIRSDVLFLNAAMTYFPGPSPTKYFQR